MEHIIPKMSDSMRRLWAQPAREDILINDVGAVMPQHAFDALKEYSSSYPSGVYPGKMWKADTGNGWKLVWYSNCLVDANRCTVNYRNITIMDWKLLMGVRPDLVKFTI